MRDSRRDPSAGNVPTEDARRRATIRDVARLAGVSVATASRVASGLAGVRPATRARVEAAIARSGYAPDPLARALAGGSGDELALVIVATPAQMCEDPHFARVVAGAASAAAEAALMLSLRLVRPGGLAALEPFTGDRRFAGALTVNVTAEMAADAIDLRRSCPVVSLGRSLPEIAFVDPDNVGGATAAVAHLLALGRRHLAMVGGPAENPCAGERAAGFVGALSEAGIRPLVEPADFTSAGGERATRRLLARHPELDALFVASDLMALGALQALREAGRAVPDDCAVVGFDDAPFARRTAPALTTIVHPVEEIASTAVRTVLAGSAERFAEERLATTLVRRASA